MDALTPREHATCRAVIKAAPGDRLARGRGMLLSQRYSIRLLHPIGEQGDFLAQVTRQAHVREYSYRIVLMGNGQVSCECADSQARKHVCKHAVAAALFGRLMPTTQHRRALAA
jgi:uncharacterized Zn finger protein